MNKALELKNVKATDLAKHIGVDRSTISFWKNGRTKPRQDKIFTSAKFLDVDPAWLFGADVPLSSFEEAMKRNNSSNELQDEAISKFNRLSIENKRQALGFISGLLFNQEK
ncbi:helix-turn-helix domain-containing protein [Apilactobacillus xinyiensis]|uniref:helix-turn-helix domain-containing protein n=1 Tax=Apilactobacillus xinyiensis TaxID=2841032 RepID=UPI001C7CF57A|nr:helix-turn-helix transcriptional regulator [Apilactobacillus xinyiensis]